MIRKVSHKEEFFKYLSGPFSKIVQTRFIVMQHYNKVENTEYSAGYYTGYYLESKTFDPILRRIPFSLKGSNEILVFGT